MCSNSGSMKLTGTLWDILRAREQENAKKQKEITKNKLSQKKRENEDNNTEPLTKKSTPEYVWKMRSEDSTAETNNIWNLPFKPIILEPAKEINASCNNKLLYILRPHNIVTIIDYSSVKRQVSVKDPRLHKYII